MKKIVWPWPHKATAPSLWDDYGRLDMLPADGPHVRPISQKDRISMGKGWAEYHSLFAAIWSCHMWHCVQLVIFHYSLIHRDAACVVMLYYMYYGASVDWHLYSICLLTCMQYLFTEISAVSVYWHVCSICLLTCLQYLFTNIYAVSVDWYLCSICLLTCMQYLLTDAIN